ncbi:MAG: hydantoinase B/oxoprolinase family protein [Pseudomonadota bacterium]|nr:hydantoinase B/oxoprolinase family protein [Pseudomonadota bacterium]
MSELSESRPIDAIEIEVFNNRVLAIIEEMGAKLVRSSFSPNIKERRDCSVALFDAGGRSIGQAAHIPIHLGSLKGGVDAILRDYPIEDIKPGDAFVCNDAYLAGGTHLPDISIITPIFYKGVLKFFAACLGHHSDVGGSVPGSISPTAASIFEEGIRIPPVKLVREGTLDDGIMQLIIQNTREPEDRLLDLKVQIATNVLGAEQITALIERMGSDSIDRAVEDLMIYTARRLRSRIAELRDGTHSFTTWMDDDGFGGDKLPLAATVTVEGDHMHLDFTGSGPQSRGGYNIMPTGVMATVAYAIKALLDPELPANSGLFDAIEFTAPEGTIVNPHYPAAVGARTTTCQKLSGAVFGAFAGLLPPEKAMASCHDVLGAMVFSGKSKKHDGTYVYLETLAGGNGARDSLDGMDGAHCHITNSLNMPAEAVEHEYPLMVEEYTLVTDSGGAGRHRGGMGVARDVRILENGTTFSGRADSYITAAEGYAGGLPGGNCRIVRNHGTNREEAMSPKQRLLTLEAGETVRMETPGGGGLGPPQDRPIAELGRDLEDGRMKEETARRDYGDEMVDKALGV